LPSEENPLPQEKTDKLPPVLLSAAAVALLLALWMLLPFKKVLLPTTENQQPQERKSEKFPPVLLFAAAANALLLALPMSSLQPRANPFYYLRLREHAW
jgi:hypothetical protein